MPVSEENTHETKIAELEKLVREIEQQRIVLGDVVAEPAITRLQAQITVLKAQAIGDLEPAYLRHIVERLSPLRLSAVDLNADPSRPGINLTAIYVSPDTTLRLASREGPLRETQFPPSIEDLVHISAIGVLASHPRLGGIGSSLSLCIQG